MTYSPHWPACPRPNETLEGNRARVTNLWPAGQMWPFSNSEEPKKCHQKVWEKWLKNTSWWPSTKNISNFPIFWPTYHKRLAIPVIEGIWQYKYRIMYFRDYNMTALVLQLIKLLSATLFPTGRASKWWQLSSYNSYNVSSKFLKLKRRKRRRLHLRKRVKMHFKHVITCFK